MEIIKEKNDIDFTVEEYLAKKSEVENIENELKAIKTKLLSMLNGKEEIVTDFHKVTNKEQIRDGINLKMLKEKYPEAYKACFNPSIYPVLRVK